MKIIFVVDGLPHSGISRVGIDYIKLLSAHGHDVSVINLSPESRAFLQQIPENCPVQDFSFPKKIVPQRYAKGILNGTKGAAAYALINGGLTLMNGIRKIFAGRKFGNADVAIAFSGHFNDLYFTADYLHAKKKIAWLHGAEFEYKMISGGYFDLYRRIQNLVCLSDLCDYTCRNFNEENRISKVKIYNPVTITQAETDENKINALKHQYGKFVLMAGRFEPDKDQKTVIRAVEYIKDKYGLNVKLLFAGSGSTFEDVKAFAESSGIRENISFLGTCNDMQNYYKAAHVFTHSSPAEGLPTVLLEALAFDLPVAATDSMPGVREILGSNECGLISPVGDWQSLGENIYRLYADSELRETLIRKGRERITDFTPEAAVQKLETFISENE